MSAHIEPVVTIEDLDAMPEDGNRYEVIEGEIFVSRAPTYIHQVIIGRFNHSLLNYLDGNPIGEVIITSGLILSPINGVIPDMIFMTNNRRQEILVDERLRAAPELVIEVLSPGAENVRRDRIAKRQLYGKYGVAEYWVIDPQTRAVEIYRARNGMLDLAAMPTGRDAITTPLLPGWSMNAAELFTI